MAQQNSPFSQGSAGQNAFKAAYDRLKAEADARKTGIGQDYSSAYQQMRGQSYAQGLGAAAQSGLSGGQAAGTRSQINAAQMGQLGSLMQGQEKALREAKVGETSIYSNALLEGQQAQQMEQQNQQANFQRQMTANQIINGQGDFANYTDEEKKTTLKTLGFTDQEIEQMINTTQKPSWQQGLDQTTGNVTSGFQGAISRIPQGPTGGSWGGGMAG
jgi:hypothetical protein